MHTISFVAGDPTVGGYSFTVLPRPLAGLMTGLFMAQGRAVDAPPPVVKVWLYMYTQWRPYDDVSNSL